MVTNEGFYDYAETHVDVLNNPIVHADMETGEADASLLSNAEENSEPPWGPSSKTTKNTNYVKLFAINRFLAVNYLLFCEFILKHSDTDIAKVVKHGFYESKPLIMITSKEKTRISSRVKETSNRVYKNFSDNETGLNTLSYGAITRKSINNSCIDYFYALNILANYPKNVLVSEKNVLVSESFNGANYLHSDITNLLIQIAVDKGFIYSVNRKKTYIISNVSQKAICSQSFNEEYLLDLFFRKNKKQIKKNLYAYAGYNIVAAKFIDSLYKMNDLETSKLIYEIDELKSQVALLKNISFKQEQYTW